MIIPFVISKRILSEFHSVHPGMSRMKSLISSYAFSPGMDQDIEKKWWEIVEDVLW